MAQPPTSTIRSAQGVPVALLLRLPILVDVPGGVGEVLILPAAPTKRKMMMTSRLVRHGNAAQPRASCLNTSFAGSAEHGAAAMRATVGSGGGIPGEDDGAREGSGERPG